MNIKDLIFSNKEMLYTNIETHRINATVSYHPNPEQREHLKRDKQLAANIGSQNRTKDQ